MAGSGGADEALGMVLGAGSPLGLGDGALVERFAARPGSASGEAAFAALVARHGAMVRRVCRQTLRSEADADDAYQAVFLVLARRAGAIRDPDLLAPWLYGVALRTARLARRRRRAFVAIATEPAAVSGGCPVEATEASEALHAEVARLPEAQRRAVVLCHWQGLTHDEAARHLGVPTGTVSVRLMRARERLRDRLARRGFAPEVPLFRALDRAGIDPPRAWAALSHLRGPTAGEVPAGVASLASGASAMSLSLPKLVALALLSTGLAATGAWSLAQSPAQPEPAPSAASPRPDDKPAPPPGPAESPDLAEFRKVYRLEPGQVLKRIPPPFAAWRTAELEVDKPQAKDFRGRVMTLIYEEDRGKLTRLGEAYKNDPQPPIWSVDYIAEALAGRRFTTVEGSIEAQMTLVAGDWVFRASASIEERFAALNDLLKQECRLPVRARFGMLERDAVVARGTFTPRPVLEGSEAIQIYGAKILLIGEQRQGGEGNFTQFLDRVGFFISPRRPVIDETTGQPAHVSWVGHHRLSSTGQTFGEDHESSAVLHHVAEQTGLTFTTERRRVPVVTIERTD